jgi:hypothetical protein
MATFIATTSSNEARLTDADAVKEVLDRYFFDGEVQAAIRYGPDSFCALVVYGYDWPAAWKLPPGAEEPDWDEDPDDGFDQFLKEIAPFLAEPLTIQAIGAEACRFPLVATEWHIAPGATEVEINGFRHSADDLQHVEARPASVLA